MKSEDIIILLDKEQDPYSRRMMINLNIITMGLSIFELISCEIVYEEDKISFKVIGENEEFEYILTDIKTKEDKKIKKFLEFFIIKEKSDYNIYVTNILEIAKYKEEDFVKLQIYRDRIKKDGEKYTYEF